MAGTASVGIAAAKIVAGVVSGSSAMLAEGAQGTRPGTLSRQWIGSLLLLVAVSLGTQSKQLLIGEALPPRELEMFAGQIVAAVMDGDREVRHVFVDPTPP